MPRRKDLNNDLTGAERTTLVNLMLLYLTDEVVKIHDVGGDRFLSTAHRLIKRMEQFLLSQGGAQFVPLPKWNPVNEVPVEFRVMKPTRQDGSPWFPQDPHLPPVQNPGANPHRAMPNKFAVPSVCGITYSVLDFAVDPWYTTVENGVGGIFAQIEVCKAVPLYWCWRAFVDEIYYDWWACPNVHPSLIYWMISKRSGQAADIKGGSLSEGAPLIQWDWHSGAHQQWTFIPLTGADDGYYLIRSVNSGLVLDVSGASTQNGAQILQWIPHEGDNQKWKLIPLSDAPLIDRHFYIQNKNSEMFMDVKGGSEVAGTKVIQWPLNGNDNQIWRILALPSP